MLDARDVTLFYSGVRAVDGVSLQVAEGRIIGLIGANGAGKASLFNVISGFSTADSGAIRFEGRAIERLRPSEIARLGIGYAPQTRNVFGALSVQENLEMVSQLLPSPRRRAGIEAAYARFPRLVERRAQAGRSLSGGERQMLAIASALIAEPRLLILDEPVSGLSPFLTDEVARGISAINAGGVSVICVVEENPQQVIGLSDDMIVMSAGAITLRQPAEAVLRADNFRELFLGVWPRPGRRRHRSVPKGESMPTALRPSGARSRNPPR